MLDQSNYCIKLSFGVVVPAALCHILDLFQYGPPGESKATAEASKRRRQNPSDLCCHPSLRPLAVEVKRDTAFSKRKVTLTALVMSLFCHLICDCATKRVCTTRAKRWEALCCHLSIRGVLLAWVDGANVEHDIKFIVLQ